MAELETVLQSHPYMGSYREPRFLWWDSLARTGSSVTLRRYFVFVFTVPVAAALINKLGFLHQLQLPLTLVLAYGAGIAFFIGAVLVDLLCPDINRPGQTYQSICQEGRTGQYVLQQLRETYMSLAKTKPDRANHFLRLFFKYFVPSLPEDLRLSIDAMIVAAGAAALCRRQVWSLAELLVQHPPDLQPAFWHVHWFATATRPYTRYSCFGAFALGAAFALGTLVVQAVTVYQAW